MLSHLVLMGANVRQDHELHYRVDRPNGYPVCSFCHFLTPTRVRASEGMEELMRDDCIFFDTRFPQWYEGIGRGFVNDWLDFDSPDLPATVEELGIPMNTRFRPSEPVFIAPIIAEIRSEWIAREAHWVRSVAGLIDHLLILVSRAITMSAALQRKDPEYYHRDGLRLARERIYRQPERQWSVAQLSRLASLSPSRFSALYRSVFGSSPFADLLLARIERAQGLLLSRHVPVSAVAERVGYDDPHYFSRLFRAKCGCAPSDYYRVATSEKEPGSPPARPL